MINKTSVITERKIVVVNAAAAKTGGALTILREFVSAISKPDSVEINYVLITSIDLYQHVPSHICVINIGGQNYIERVLWDYYGFKRYLKSKGIIPNLILSFQNTGVVFPKMCPQVVYFHNPFCLVPKQWNIFKKNERTLFFYTFIYPLFIRALINQNTSFIVQANWIKDAFSKRFKFDKEKISVVIPSVQKLPDIVNADSKLDKIRFFFPATSYLYKNHELLFDMLVRFQELKPEMYESTELLLTLSEKDIRALGLFEKYSILRDKIILKGYVDIIELTKCYMQSDLILFPSTIETFGLPLVEAASLNKKIICSDLPFAYETLEGYSNVKFISPTNSDKWATTLVEFLDIRSEDNSAFIESRVQHNSWKDIIEIIKNTIN